MKRYSMMYTGEDKVAAALDDLLSYLHNSEMFGQKVNLKSHTVRKAMIAMREREIKENGRYVPEVA